MSAPDIVDATERARSLSKQAWSASTGSIRPIGRPRKIVSPAIAPSARICPVPM